FTTNRVRTVWPLNFSHRDFQPAVRSTKLPESLRFHDLRHTCAALLIAAGQHLEEVKQYLGHSSIRVTSDRYGHLFPTGKEAMRDGLETTYETEGRDTRSGADSAQTVAHAWTKGHSDQVSSPAKGQPPKP